MDSFDRDLQEDESNDDSGSEIVVRNIVVYLLIYSNCFTFIVFLLLILSLLYVGIWQ